MTMDDQTISRLKGIYYLAIILCVLQFITTLAIMILVKSVLDLKRSIQKYKKNPMSLVNNTTPQSSQNLHPDVALGNKQKQELLEVVYRMPTPDPDRRNLFKTTYKVSAAEATLRMHTTSSGILSRDSGTESMWGRNTSLSSDCSRYSEGRSRISSQTSQERVSVHEDSRTARDASGFSNGSKRKIPTILTSQTVSQNVNNDDGTSQSSRRVTMAIENISLDESKRRKRASRAHSEGALIEEKGEENLSCANYDSSNFNQSPPNVDNDHEICLPSCRETMAIEDIDHDEPKRRKRGSRTPSQRAFIEEKGEENLSFVNHDFISNSECPQRRAPLPSEECSVTSDTQTEVDENVERYKNQIIVDQNRYSGEFFISSL